MQLFNHSNSEVEYIKDILRSEYIPTVRIFNTDITSQPAPKTSCVWSPSGEDMSTVSSSQTDKDSTVVFSGESVIYNNSIYVGDSHGEKRYVENYKFGNWYKNITTNFISNKSYYDYNLHENLGRYLRAYRDYYAIDVMNMYNCFSNRYINQFSLPFYGYSVDDKLVPFDSRFSIVAFPIIYDTEYRVVFNCNYVGEVTVQAIYFSNDVPLSVAEGTSKNPITYKINVDNEFFFRIGSKNNLSDSDDVINTDDEIFRRLSKQRLLYILIQFPSSSSSKKIVVLEQPKYTNALNNSLLQMNELSDSDQVAFSDSLIGYLTGNVITTSTTPGDSISYIQDIISSDEFLNYFGVGGKSLLGSDQVNYRFKRGVFDLGMQRIIYKALYMIANKGGNRDSSELAILNRTTNIYNMFEFNDFMGFIDKDVESFFRYFWSTINNKNKA